MATMSLRTQVAQALGKRVTIRLRDTDGGFRDIVGVLQSETSLINRRGEVISFDPDDAVAFRIIPVFNRRDIATGSLSMYDTMSRALKTISGRDGAVRIYCCGPTVYRDAHVGNIVLSALRFNFTNSATDRPRSNTCTEHHRCGTYG